MGEGQFLTAYAHFVNLCRTYATQPDGPCAIGAGISKLLTQPGAVRWLCTTVTRGCRPVQLVVHQSLPAWTHRGSVLSRALQRG